MTSQTSNSGTFGVFCGELVYLEHLMLGSNARTDILAGHTSAGCFSASIYLLSQKRVDTDISTETCQPKVTDTSQWK